MATVSYRLTSDNAIPQPLSQLLGIMIHLILYSILIKEDIEAGLSLASLNTVDNLSFSSG